MKKLCFFLILISLSFLGVKCQCNDCGDLAVISYALKNELGDEIDVRFRGEYNNLDFQLNIPGSDTSSAWLATLNPVGHTAWDHFFNGNGVENSFPGHADSVYIFHERILLKKWSREDDKRTQNLESIFSFDAYENVEKDFYLFRIDSLKLGLE